MATIAKICGLSTEESVKAALTAGASYIGFVFYPPSPRDIEPETAGNLAAVVDGNALMVGVFVNPDDALLMNVLKNVELDFIQLHGNETIERVQYIKNRFKVMVIKAISVASASDIARAKEYEHIADMLLFDAKVPKDLENALPGGNGLEFDWNLISGKTWNIPWMLSGGLDATNVEEAIKISGAEIVDVSSGVEISPGNKDKIKINAFMKAVQESNNGS